MDFNDAIRHLSETVRDLGRRLHHLETLETQAGHSHNLLHDHDYFMAYDAAGGIDISAGWTDLTLDTEAFKDDPPFTHAAGAAEVTIDEDGDYRIVLDVGTEITLGGGRSDSEARLMLDIGGGYSEIAGTRGGMYNRTLGFDLSSCSITRIINLSAGDKIKGQAQRNSGTDTVETRANSVRLSIEKLPT